METTPPYTVVNWEVSLPESWSYLSSCLEDVVEIFGWKIEALRWKCFRAHAMQEVRPADHNFTSGFKTFYLLNIYIRNYTGLIILCICALYLQGSVVVFLLWECGQIYIPTWCCTWTVMNTLMEEWWLLQKLIGLNWCHLINKTAFRCN